MPPVVTKNADGSTTLAAAGVTPPPDAYVANPGAAIPLNTLNTPVNPTPFVNPNPVPVPIIPAVPALAETPAETKANDITKRLMDLEDNTVGKSAYTTAQENAAGIPELKQTQTDLTTQLNTLKNEADQIPLQLQNDVEGRGVTTGGLEPIQTGALRNNAIKALTINSLLTATQGNITSAEDLVTRAVNAKYGPIEEEIAANTANLKLIIDSPEYSNEDKTRAEQQLEAQTARQDALDKQKDDAKTILTTATTAATNVASFIPTADYPTAASAIAAISKADTPADAVAIASATGLTQAPLDSAMIEEYKYAKQNGYKGSFSQYQNEDANRKNIAAGGFSTTQLNSGASNAGVSSEQFSTLPRDVQNLFINNKDVGNLLVGDVAGVKSGDIDRADAVDDINSQNITQAAKNYFISLLPDESTSSSSGGGFGGWLNGFFNGFGNNAGPGF